MPTRNAPATAPAAAGSHEYGVDCGVDSSRHVPEVGDVNSGRLRGPLCEERHGVGVQGVGRTPGKRVGSQGSRGFESRLVRCSKPCGHTGLAIPPHTIYRAATSVWNPPLGYLARVSPVVLRKMGFQGEHPAAAP